MAMDAGWNSQDTDQQYTQEGTQQGLSQVAQQAQASAGGLTEQAKQQITTQLSNQKDRVSTGIGSVAEALRQAGQQMQQQGPAPVADYANKAADQVDRLSQYLSAKDLNELQADAAQFARSQPVVFLAGAFALGWLGARFFKSSSPAQQASQSGSGYVQPPMSGTGASPYAGAPSLYAGAQ
jgi:hypothetical protein